MAKYIDVVLTSDGTFCIAPPWTVGVGDYISMENVLNGITELKKVIATATDSTDGDFIKLVEAYLGYKPYRITSKYRENTLFWEAENDLSE